MKSPEIVPATFEHFDAMNEKIRRGGKAIAAVLDGETLGIAGYYFENGRIILYSPITPELRRFRKTIVRGARIVMDMASKVKAPVHAVAQDVPGAETLLEHFGFQQMENGVYGRSPWAGQV